MQGALLKPTSDPAILQKGKQITPALQTLGISWELGTVVVLWYVLDITEGGDVGRTTAFTGSDVMVEKNK